MKKTVITVIVLPVFLVVLASIYVVKTGTDSAKLGKILNLNFTLVGEAVEFVVPVEIDSKIVAKWLPEGLQLAPLGDKHPVLIILTDTDKVSPRFGSLELNFYPFNLIYKEVTIQVTNVMISPKDGEKNSNLFSYNAKLYLDDWPAIYYGWVFYGMPKEYGEMAMSENSFELVNENTPLLNFLADSSASETIATDHPNFRKYSQKWELPRISLMDGEFVCWRGRTAEGKETVYTPIRAQTTLNEKLAEGLATMRVHSKGLDEDASGAFKRKVAWEFFQTDCHSSQQSIAARH